MSGELEEPERVLAGDEFVCLLESDVLSIEFSAPFDEQYVDTDRLVFVLCTSSNCTYTVVYFEILSCYFLSFEVGIGFYAGTDDYLTFTSFTPSLVTSSTYSHTLTHFNPRSVGRRPIYITVQAHSMQNPLYIFKLSSPPVYIKSDINTWDSQLLDGVDPNTDAEFQTSTTEIAAHLSIGTHCPVSYVRWAVEDANGTIVSDYLDYQLPLHNGRYVQNDILLITDQVKLYNEETYRVLVQASDITGEVFILRSNGVTVTTDDLVPGLIWDGPNPNEDLSYQEPTDYLSASWSEFGDGTPQQEISYYEVAAGSNMGHPNTRTDIAPFTNIGLNMSHTFTDLSLVPESVLYSITVRATAVSGAVTEATSNGLRIGLTHSITAGAIFTPPFSSNATELWVYWEEFESNVPIRTYEWAVGESEFTSEQLQHMCQEYLSDFEDEFEVLPFTSVGLSTTSFLLGLNLTHNSTYYITIRATDEANKCLAVMSSGMLVDLTTPTRPLQSIRAGPLESLVGIGADSRHIIYTHLGDDLSVWWDHFTDRESGIASYQVSLFQQETCGYNDLLVPLTEYVDVGLEQSFVFKQPDLEPELVYVVGVKAANQAGLDEVAYSEPILVDWSDVVSGTIKDGLNWSNDVVFQSDLSMLSGVFTHAKLAPQYPGVVLQNDPCPNTTFYSLSEVADTWRSLSPATIAGIDSSAIHYSSTQTNISSNGLTISTVYDGEGGFLSGAYQTKVDLSLDGSISLDIQAALSSSVSGDVEFQEQSITSVVFSGATDDNILVDFDESRDHDFSMLSDIAVVGFQIHHRHEGRQQNVMLWSKPVSPLLPVAHIAHFIPEIDLSQVHTYTLDFKSEKLDTDVERWVDLYIDGQLTATLHSIPQFSNTTLLTLHVFNRNGFVPPIIDAHDIPQVKALFANITVPRERDHICDFGLPFFSSSSPVVQFSVGAGSSPGLTDISELQVHSLHSMYSFVYSKLFAVCRENVRMCGIHMYCCV